MENKLKNLNHKAINPITKRAGNQDIAEYQDVIELVNDTLPGNYFPNLEHKRAIGTELLRRLLIYKELRPEQFQHSLEKFVD